MAKFSKQQKLPKGEREQILYEFIVALSEIHDTQEAMDFVRDLLSEQETEMLAKRVKVAELLIDGRTYIEIEHQLSVGHSTIARVGGWLQQSGSGYRVMVDRIKKKRGQEPEQRRKFDEWSKMKRRYPIMFWPQLLLEEIVASSNKRQKDHLRSMLEEMDEKSELHKRIATALSSSKKRSKTIKK
ncbi:MAG: YerC/YecD family TrpR-related protein [bacterium]|nr:YerC/YecD family TrpR-related protein [bacterium]